MSSHKIVVHWVQQFYQCEGCASINCAWIFLRLVGKVHENVSRGVRSSRSAQMHTLIRNLVFQKRIDITSIDVSWWGLDRSDCAHAQSLRWIHLPISTFSWRTINVNVSFSISAVKTENNMTVEARTNFILKGKMTAIQKIHVNHFKTDRSVHFWINESCTINYYVNLPI